jgi:hypothetical protein
MKPICCAPVAGGCARPVALGGLCVAHWTRRKRGRPINTPVLEKHAVLRHACQVADCGMPEHVRGYCRNHYARLLRGRDLLAAMRIVKTGRGCKASGCPGRYLARGLCQTHYQRLRKTGSLELVKRVPRSHVSSDGYRIIYVVVDGKSVPIAEHRLVMSRALGRPLLRNESVHHKNGVRLDNRRRNLELWTKSQPAGQRVKDLLAWARELIALYGDVESKIT